jgi:hypothetical protein
MIILSSWTTPTANRSFERASTRDIGAVSEAKTPVAHAPNATQASKLLKA